MLLFSWQAVSRSFATPSIDCVARQAPLSMGFPRQEYWSGLPFPPLGDLPDPGIEPAAPVWQVDSLPLNHQGAPRVNVLLAIKVTGMKREAGEIPLPHPETRVHSWGVLLTLSCGPFQKYFMHLEVKTCFFLFYLTKAYMHIFPTFVFSLQQFILRIVLIHLKCPCSWYSGRLFHCVYIKFCNLYSVSRTGSCLQCSVISIHAVWKMSFCSMQISQKPLCTSDWSLSQLLKVCNKLPQIWVTWGDIYFCLQICSFSWQNSVGMDVIAPAMAGCGAPSPRQGSLPLPRLAGNAGAS